MSKNLKVLAIEYEKEYYSSHNTNNNANNTRYNSNNTKNTTNNIKNNTKLLILLRILLILMLSVILILILPGSKNKGARPLGHSEPGGRWADVGRLVVSVNVFQMRPKTLSLGFRV